MKEIFTLADAIQNRPPITDKSESFARALQSLKEDPSDFIDKIYKAAVEDPLVTNDNCALESISEEFKTYATECLANFKYCVLKEYEKLDTGISLDDVYTALHFTTIFSIDWARYGGVAGAIMFGDAFKYIKREDSIKRDEADSIVKAAPSRLVEDNFKQMLREVLDNALILEDSPKGPRIKKDSFLQDRLMREANCNDMPEDKILWHLKQVLASDTVKPHSAEMQIQCYRAAQVARSLYASCHK